MAETLSRPLDVAPPLPEGSSFLRLLSALPLSGRNGLILAAVATILALTTMIWFATRPSFKVLYSGLSEEEGGRIVEQLHKMNVLYELTAQGTTISVPNDKAYDVRLELATMGIPKKSGGVGFEIFDKTSLVGMTDFMQRINYQRALEGELGHTIESISAVQKARVHLTMPKKSLFTEEAKEASASVVLDLSHALTPDQINGIVHLVSGAVEDLDGTKVTILDQKGNLIAGGKKAGIDGRMAADDSISLQQQIEKALEERVQSMLDRVLGPDRSIIRVNAELDLSRVDRQEEKFDPDGQVPRSEQQVTENSNGNFGNGGAPGVTANDANASSSSSSSASRQSRVTDRQTTNYEISKTVNRIQLPVGTVKRLSVAVLIDGIAQTTAPGSKSEYKPRSAEEMTRLQQIIEQAVGLRKDRGDTIQVTNAPFEPIVLPGTAETSIWKQHDFQIQAAKLGGMAILMTLLVFLVLRPLISKLLIPEKVTEPGTLPTTVAELEQQLLAEGVGSLPSERPQRVVIPDRSLQLSQQMISDHADEAREIIRSWLMQGENS